MLTGWHNPCSYFEEYSQFVLKNPDFDMFSQAFVTRGCERKTNPTDVSRLLKAQSLKALPNVTSSFATISRRVLVKCGRSAQRRVLKNEDGRGICREIDFPDYMQILYLRSLLICERD